MAARRTIHGELRLPPGLLHGQPMEEIEHQLHAAGVLPMHTQARTWRMDHDTPGGYILAYTVVLPQAESPSHA